MAEREHISLKWENKNKFGIRTKEWRNSEAVLSGLKAISQTSESQKVKEIVLPDGNGPSKATDWLERAAGKRSISPDGMTEMTRLEA